ncbi:PAS domain-containing protein [Pseudogemmobacter humi]|uniref:PAS domain protein n=1 Tax=Pseudogemmobacter humi TaxID=2483812 RepID=A0A3P5X740_9RHOB|nr:PAS domain-containing protein [Pseudogemmobacter humi]VDC30174.1 PAS domain protein [Pseudogemmobacter humi]
MPFRAEEANPAAPPRFQSLQRLRAYWEALTDECGGPPEASRLDPRGLAPALSEVFLGERIGRGLVRLRIAGQSVSALAGLDMQGLPLSSLFLPAARPALADTIERVFTHTAAVEMQLQAETGIGRPPLEARLLLLPLAAPAYGPAAVLGCLSSHGAPGRAPRRFTVIRVSEERQAPPPETAPEAPTGAGLPARHGLRLVHSTG